MAAEDSWVSHENTRIGGLGNEFVVDVRETSYIGGEVLVVGCKSYDS